MGGTFNVDSSALTTASAAFLAQHAALVAAITAFQSSALDVNDAFGMLGPSLSVLKSYETTTEDAFRALDQLAALLDDAANGLTTTATNYASADGASSMHGG